MDDDKIKGKFEDIKGRVKRQAGEWTGDENAQAEGTMDQAKGKIQNAWGNVKEKAREVADDMKRNRDVSDKDKDVA